MNVVIIEDEGITAFFLEESINDLHHNVVAMFDNSDELLLFLQTNWVDLILMDINIKGALDGIQTANIVHDKYPTVLFVFLTSIKDSETIKSAQRVKPLGYLIKPVLISDLEAIMMVVEAHKESAKEIVEVTLGAYVYDLKRKVLSRESHPISLGKNTATCVHALVVSKNSFVSSQQLMYTIWNDTKDRNSSLRELIFRLRKKLPDLPLESSPNLGYRLSSG